MAYTMDQLNALRAAIAQGARVVQYADKRVEYRSLAEMQQIERRMSAELEPASTSGKGGRRFASHDKGL